MKYFLFLGITSSLIAAYCVQLYTVDGISAFKDGPPFPIPYNLFIAIFLALLFGVGSWIMRAQTTQSAPYFNATTALTPSILLALSVVIANISPLLYNYLAMEDHLVEWLTAICFLIGSGLFFILLIKNFLRHKTIFPKKVIALQNILFTLAGLVLFIIGMEEISWMQRIMSFDTPELLKNYNSQGEFNFHNLHTSFTELAFYSGGFVFLILLPFLYDVKLRNISFFQHFKDYIPDKSIIYIAAPLTACTYDMWRIFPITMGFILTIVILVFYAAIAWKEKRAKDAHVSLSIALICLLSQISLLYTGDDFIRGWDATEYKEFLIGIACLCYSILIFNRGCAFNLKT